MAVLPKPALPIRLRLCRSSTTTSPSSLSARTKRSTARRYPSGVRSTKSSLTGALRVPNQQSWLRGSRTVSAPHDAMRAACSSSADSPSGSSPE